MKRNDVISNMYRYLYSLPESERQEWIKVMNEKYPIQDKRDYRKRYRQEHRSQINEQQRPIMAEKYARTKVGKYPAIAFDLFSGVRSYDSYGNYSKRHEIPWTYLDKNPNRRSRAARCRSCNAYIANKPGTYCHEPRHRAHYDKRRVRKHVGYR